MDISVLYLNASIWSYNDKMVTWSLPHSSIQARPRRSNASLIMQRLEEVSRQPVLPPVSPPPLEEVNPPGLPSYFEAISGNGPHDAPPPPYPG